MSTKHTRESSRTLARKRQARIIRTIFLLIGVTIAGGVSFKFWRHEAYHYFRQASDSFVAGSNLKIPTEPIDPRTRSVVASIVFAERQVVQLNAKGENVPDKEAIFSIAPAGPSEFEIASVQEVLNPTAVDPEFPDLVPPPGAKVKTPGQANAADSSGMPAPR